MFDDPPPFRTLALAVDGGHVLHVRQSGNPRGIAALVLHGGPGSGCTPLLRRFLDPTRFHVICVDQRGAGCSTPRGAIAANDTAHLLADLRALRDRLGVARWLVVGGSWGATLALAHALDAPDAVAGLLLRGAFLARAQDIDGFFGPHDGLDAMALPDWQAVAPAAHAALARAWWRRERHLAGLGPAAAPHGEELAVLVDRYRVQAHYLRHRCWLDQPPLLDRVPALPRVPTVLLHGTQDRICPPDGARALAARLPWAVLRWVEGAGHDPSHPAMAAAMVEALARLARDVAADVPAGGRGLAA